MATYIAVIGDKDFFEHRYHKYISREWKNGRWRYTYPQNKYGNKKGNSTGSEKNDRVAAAVYDADINHDHIIETAEEDHAYMQAFTDAWNRRDTLNAYAKYKVSNAATQRAKAKGQMVMKNMSSKTNKLSRTAKSKTYEFNTQTGEWTMHINR